ncbi:hypothetical protein [Paenibacillus graminis]|uniref:hypothetical protein n=1 Tax=Paenibacillus graminis TaxID=189425 RepID=UPI000FB48DC2|nr:hypothetical protein [Paenibacillus graminis]MEC0167329.1 hypothetical protein [Paenibacillus graminis]
MNDTRKYYIGIHPDVLEPVSLEHSSFGALWYEEKDQRYIVGYGFGASQIEILTEFSTSSALITCTDLQIIHQIYQSIRNKQQEQDWSAHRRFPLLTFLREPWKSMSPGWYILRSRKAFPLHLSIVQRTNYAVWLEHTAVCEDEAELAACIAKAEQIHHLHIKSMDTLGGIIHE